MRHTKLMLASLTAALLLATAVGTASARRLSFDGPAFRVVWRLLIFSAEGFEPISCPVTLEGTFHSFTLHKVLRALIGYVTRATTVPGACTGGRATALQEGLPWHITYQGFRGILPIIEGVRVLGIGARYRIESGGGANCLCTTTAAEPSEGEVTIIREAGGQLKTREDIPNSERKITCRGILNFMGSFSQNPGESIVTRLGSTTALLVKLI